MYWDALKWAYEGDLPKSVKLGTHAVLVALVYSMNPRTGECYPSVERLVRLTRMKTSAVKSALKTLKAENIISLVHGKRKTKSSSYVVNYTVLPKRRKAKSAEPPPTPPPTTTAPTPPPSAVAPTPPPAAPVMAPATPFVPSPRSKPAPAKPAGLTAARKVIEEWANQHPERKHYSRMSDTGDDGMIYRPIFFNIEDILALFPDPKPEDIDNILSAHDDKSELVDSYVLTIVLESVQKAIKKGRKIRSMRAYFFSSLKNHLDNEAAIEAKEAAEEAKEAAEEAARDREHERKMQWYSQQTQWYSQQTERLKARTKM